MIEKVPATPAHIIAILSNPSDQTLADAKAVDLSLAELAERLSTTLPDDDAAVALEDGKPIVALGWEKHGDVWYSWLLASPEFFDPERPGLVLFSRRHMRSVAKQNPGVTLLMVPVVKVTPQIRHWMRLLGFRFLPNRGFMGLFIYEGVTVRPRSARVH